MVKFYKILNLSAASGIVEAKDGEIMIKANDVYNKVSLAPNWESALVWADVLISGALYDEMPLYKERYLIVGEVEFPSTQKVRFLPNALTPPIDINKWEEVKALEAHKASIDGWNSGSFESEFGLLPEVRVDGPVKINKLYLLDTGVIDERPVEDISYDFDMSEEWEEQYNEYQDHLESWVERYKASIKDARDKTIEIDEHKLEEIMEELRS